MTTTARTTAAEMDPFCGMLETSPAAVLKGFLHSMSSARQKTKELQRRLKQQERRRKHRKGRAQAATATLHLIARE